MTLKRRFLRLEAEAAQKKEEPDLTQRMRGEEERLLAHASPEAVARYDAAIERMAAAHESSEAELGAAADEYLDALEVLDNERREGY
jgi:hypothetical protein